MNESLTKYIEDNKITKWLTEISFPISQNYNAMYGTSTVFSLLDTMRYSF